MTHGTRPEEAVFDRLATAALARYPASRRAELTFIRHGENATFRVDDSERSFALRLARPGYHTAAGIRSEIAWMDALHAAGINTPRPVRGRNGEVVQDIAIEGRGHIAVAFEWVDGVPLPEATATDPWIQLGRIMARIHDHGRQWSPPAGFERPAWDAQALVGARPRWGTPCPAGAWSDTDRRLLLAARDAVRHRLSRFGTSADRFGLLHADLGFENVLVTNDGTAVVIDFDDCGPSWYLYEFASVLYPLENDNRFRDYFAALVAGYRGSAELTDDVLAELPTFLMCRRLATLGWMFSRPETQHAQQQRTGRLRTSPAAAARFLDWHAANPAEPAAGSMRDR